MTGTLIPDLGSFHVDHATGTITTAHYPDDGVGGITTTADDALWGVNGTLYPHTVAGGGNGINVFVERIEWLAVTGTPGVGTLTLAAVTGGMSMDYEVNYFASATACADRVTAVGKRFLDGFTMVTDAADLDCRIYFRVEIKTGPFA